jgi:hypothetical protein
MLSCRAERRGKRSKLVAKKEGRDDGDV